MPLMIEDTAFRIAENALLTADFAVFTAVEIDDFIPFHMDVTVDLMLLNVFETLVFTELNTDETVFEILFIIEEIDALIPFQILLTVFFIAFHEC